MLGKNSKTMRNFKKRRHFFAKMQNGNSVFFCEIFAFFAEHIEAKFRKKISFIRVTDLREFSYFSRANEIQKYAKMFTKIFYCEIIANRFFPFCCQSHQNEWEDFFLFAASPIKTSERWVFQTRAWFFFQKREIFFRLNIK